MLPLLNSGIFNQNIIKRKQDMPNNIGSIHGKNGQYIVYHNAPSDSSLFYRNGAGSSCSTKFKVASSGNGLSGPDGSQYSSAADVLSAIQAKYISGSI